jgi:glutaredoxin 3
MKKLILPLFVLSTTVFADDFAPKPAETPKETAEKRKPEVIVYSSDLCSWCTSAKEILEEHKVTFKEINVRGNKKLIDEMEQKTGKRTVPQIIIDGKHIGSYLALAAANMTGELDQWLGKDADGQPLPSEENKS